MREYIVSGSGLTVAGASTLVIINPLAGQTIEITRAWASQSANATSAQQRVELGLKSAAFGTYVAATPAKTKSSDPISLIVGGTAGTAGQAGINASAEGAGATAAIVPDAFNVLVGYLWTPNFSLGETIMLNSAAAAAFYMRFPVAPANLTNWTFGVAYRELG
jgi:hypothetical protein